MIPVPAVAIRTPRDFCLPTPPVAVSLRNLPHSASGGRLPLREFRFFVQRFLRNRLAVLGLVLVAGILLMAASSFFIATGDSVIRQNLPVRLQPPSSQHWLGTDFLGRDIFRRILYGSRISLLVGITVVAIGMTLGTALGMLAGFLGGWWDRAISRMIDIMLAFPFLLLAIAVAATLGPSLRNVILALGFATFPAYARLVRGCVLSIREEQYVDAARAIGVGPVRIMVRHVLPNLFGTLLVYGTLRISTAILAESGLSFLGLGPQPPTPTWGNMLSEGREYLLDYGWLPLFPGLAILFTVMGFNLLGDGLRDLLDPRMKDSR
ncbi:MAG: ABC transporter permease [Candidatus Sumerlaeia bacterium]|nr:ABC transporter permease [Candidatus Sumerlaeia bacterium]